MSDIIFNLSSGRCGKIGEVVLNRPKALNSLTLEMCQQLALQLQQWQDDLSVFAVVIRGEGDRAFCAGGDIRAIYDNGIDNAEQACAFFKTEYAMNKIIFHFTKPYIAFLHGIVMGGGVGVSLHGTVRIASDDFLFAMPETGIGFFPDIGAGYFLTRCPYYIGRYLGLTGARIKRADAFALGLVTHCINKENWPRVIAGLRDCEVNAIAATLSECVTEAGESEIMQHKTIIEQCFGADSVEEIFKRLQNSNDAFALATLETLKQKSPLSLKVTLEQLKRAASMSYDQINAMEYKIACQFANTPDFYEGVRAAVVDKDRQPKWQFAELKNITPQQIMEYF